MNCVGIANGPRRVAPGTPKRTSHLVNRRRPVDSGAAEAAEAARGGSDAAAGDETTHQRLAEQLAPTITQHLIDGPWLSDPAEHLSPSVHVTRQTVSGAMWEPYEPSQVDELARAGLLAHERLRETHEEKEREEQ